MCVGRKRVLVNTRATEPCRISRPSIVRPGLPIASVIERGWQGNYFLGVGDVRAPHGGGVRGHAVGSDRLRTANQRSTLPVFGGDTVHVGISTRVCARVPRRHACSGCDVPPIARLVPTNSRCGNRDDTLANTSTCTWTCRASYWWGLFPTRLPLISLSRARVDICRLSRWGDVAYHDALLIRSVTRSAMPFVNSAASDEFEAVFFFFKCFIKE